MDTAVTHLRTRTRTARPDRHAEDVRRLEDVLADPNLSGWHDDARAELDRLTNTRIAA